jgi:hypothetical protein
MLDDRGIVQLSAEARDFSFLQSMHADFGASFAFSEFWELFPGGKAAGA